ncbi:hypothetical protein Hbl1158_16935 (plasmid) [Halobaculum sp. CBA1158]|uniref:hypothetical protein n=1 Tax=Halobaculum sp. CBA1158 TaxID=2904243 RepID=UPI001F3327D6|nr:hypothetical protein [Halobaculum sp. CBA1158]UIP01740.1 hypothetical protein Hbl1158_16935 [Halobaculum sp. CBA1158]
MNRSVLYRNWYEQVVLPPTNDFIVCISASSRTPVSGTGKTTLGTGVAKSLDRSEDGFDAESQATLSADEFANEVIPDAPDQAAVLIDETQGTPGGGSGMNRMRAMSQSTMDAIGSLLANRDKNLTVVVVVQRLGMLFSDFFPLIDAWLLISKAPGQIGGPEVKHHKVFTEDYPDAGDGMRTPIVEFLDWPAIPEDDEDYVVMERKKQKAKTKGGDDGDGELPDEEQLRWARQAYFQSKDIDCSWRNLPAVVNDNEEEYAGIELTYSGEWYRQRLSNEQSGGKQTA